MIHSPENPRRFTDKAAPSSLLRDTGPRNAHVHPSCHTLSMASQSPEKAKKCNPCVRYKASPMSREAQSVRMNIFALQPWPSQTKPACPATGRYSSTPHWSQFHRASDTAPNQNDSKRPMASRYPSILFGFTRYALALSA